MNWQLAKLTVVVATVLLAVTIASIQFFVADSSLILEVSPEALVESDVSEDIATSSEEIKTPEETVVDLLDMMENRDALSPSEMSELVNMTDTPLKYSDEEAQRLINEALDEL